MQSMNAALAYLNGRCIDIKFLEDRKGLLIKLTADADGGNIWGVVVVQAVDVFTHTSRVCLYGSQDQKILQVSAHIRENNGISSSQIQ